MTYSINAIDGAAFDIDKIKQILCTCSNSKIPKCARLFKRGWNFVVVVFCFHQHTQEASPEKISIADTVSV